MDKYKYTTGLFYSAEELYYAGHIDTETYQKIVGEIYDKIDIKATASQNAAQESFFELTKDTQDICSAAHEACKNDWINKAGGIRKEARYMFDLGAWYKNDPVKIKFNGD